MWAWAVRDHMGGWIRGGSLHGTGTTAAWWEASDHTRLPPMVGGRLQSHRALQWETALDEKGPLLHMQVYIKN
jgi:hypothetical protein